MRRTADITLTMSDIVLHNTELLSFTILDVVKDKIGTGFTDVEILDWTHNLVDNTMVVVYDYKEVPQIDIEHMEGVILEILGRIHDHQVSQLRCRDISGSTRLENQIREVFMDNFIPIEE
jgi:hypothetical protein